MRKRIFRGLHRHERQEAPTFRVACEAPAVSCVSGRAPAPCICTALPERRLDRSIVPKPSHPQLTAPECCPSRRPSASRLKSHSVASGQHHSSPEILLVSASKGPSSTRFGPLTPMLRTQPQAFLRQGSLRPPSGFLGLVWDKGPTPGDADRAAQSVPPLLTSLPDRPWWTLVKPQTLGSNCLGPNLGSAAG